MSCHKDILSIHKFQALINRQNALIEILKWNSDEKAKSELKTIADRLKRHNELIESGLTACEDADDECECIEGFESCCEEA